MTTRAIRILCSTRRHPFSYAIRFLNFSRWSHEAIIDGDQVIEALGSTGVRRIAMDAAVNHYLDYGVLEFIVPEWVTEAQIEEVWVWLRLQIGKGYDWQAIAWQWFGRLISLFGRERDWQDEKRWYCFELRRAFLQRLGIYVERDDGVVQRAADCWGTNIGRVVVQPGLLQQA